MNFSYYIARKLKVSRGGKFASLIHRIAVSSIALGLGLIIISVLILGGFKQTIKDKIYSVTAHLQVKKYTLGNNYEDEPIDISKKLLQTIDSLPEVEEKYIFATKVGLLKANAEVLGVMLKGVSDNFDTAGFRTNMKKGKFFEFPDSGYSEKVVISEFIARKLKLDTGSTALIYFIQNPPRVRRLEVSGIYSTQMEDFDEKLILGDINLVRRLNNWGDTLAGGIQIMLNSDQYMAKTADQLYAALDYNLLVQRADYVYAEIFDWLNLLDRNVVIFMTIILAVACFNMVSILIILILERTRMVGILKALGATNATIRRVFIYTGMRIILKGVLIGNLIGIGFGLVQKNFMIVGLDPTSYYMAYVPIQWDIGGLMLVNLLTFLVVSLSLLIPAGIITRMHPVKSIRFD